MTDIAITNDGDGWDLELVDGDLRLLADRDEVVAQRLVFRLSTWRGESTYDRAAGIPYIGGVFGVQPISGILGLFDRETLATEGVDEIIDRSYLLDDRALSVTLRVRASDSDVSVALEIAP